MQNCFVILFKIKQVCFCIKCCINNYIFRNLKSLLLFDLPEVKDKNGCKAHIEKALPDCKVDYRDIKK